MPIVSNQPVSECAHDLLTRLQSIADLNGKALFVFSEDDLLDKIKGVTLPAVGIVYEGMRSMPEQGTAKVGISCELVFSLAVINRPEVLSKADTKTVTLNLLDQIRQTLLVTRSPTGHYWKFVVEAATSVRNGTVFWVSRWSTPIQLTHQ